jgi:V/A-type H+-transporting ATPase subunit I
MKRFYVAVPQEMEEDVAEALGRLGYIELFAERKQTIAGEEALETYSSFLRIYDRARLALSSIYELVPPDAEEKTFLDKLRSAFMLPTIRRAVRKIGLLELKETIPKYEGELSEYSSKLDHIRRRVSEIDELISRIEIFRRYKIGLDTVGDYTHIFVKAGFIPEANVSRLKDALKPFNVVLSIMEGRPKEKFILIAGSQKDKESIVNILTMLNLDEIVLPDDIVADPEEAYRSLMGERESLYKELVTLKSSLESFIDGMEPYVRYIRFMYNVRSMVLKTRNFSIFYGWVPADRLDDLRSRVSEVTKGLLHIEAVDPDPESDVKPPTHFNHPGLIDKFQLIVRMRGIPNYYELDPTIFYTILFSIMFGMMFGDVGQGIVLFIIGQILYRVRKSFIGISYSALNRLGAIISVASISSIFFGFLYGESFLLHFMDPIWLNPLEDPIGISVVAILFGVFQLIIGISLNIVNDLLDGDYVSALFSWRGVVGLVYYIIGVLLAVRFVLGGMSFEVFGTAENLPLVIIEIILLFVAFLKPTIENILHGGGHPFSETIMEGVSEFIEMFLSYVTNSISYVRLGAFAIAHVALAEVAGILAEPMGFLPSYIIFNIIVILIEGFSAGIQSIRLLFYEFSTKFYRDEGRLFRPIRL